MSAEPNTSPCGRFFTAQRKRLLDGSSIAPTKYLSSEVGVFFVNPHQYLVRIMSVFLSRTFVNEMGNSGTTAVVCCRLAYVAEARGRETQRVIHRRPSCLHLTVTDLETRLFAICWYHANTAIEWFLHCTNTPTMGTHLLMVLLRRCASRAGFGPLRACYY